jgi:protein-S-isoprenylcysteine O-methyltransferase Ste14
MAWSAIPLPAWARWVWVVVAPRNRKEMGDQPRIMETQKFNSSGQYLWVRHPIYTAFLMILGATLLITDNWFIGGLWILLTGVYICGRINFEEEKMLAQFGEEYQRYLEKTGALLPKLRKSQIEE